MSAPRYLRHPRVVVREDGDGAVALHLDTHQYFELNGSARFVWERLGDGATAEALVTALTSAFEVTDTDARGVVDELLATLCDEGLVVVDGERRRDRLARWLRGSTRRGR